MPRHRVGIAAIGCYQPDWTLNNDWYQPNMPRKFTHHTGICSRRISDEDEVALAAHAIDELSHQVPLRWKDCAALVVTCPSLIPPSIAHRHLDRAAARREQPTRLAHALSQRLGIAPRRVLGINAFCSGYARALSLVLHTLHARQGLGRDEFILVVTTNRISRITDFACPQSGALFGDLATATLIARCDSPQHRVRFEVIDAWYAKRPSAKPYFGFDLRSSVLVPTRAGGRQIEPNRLVFTLDGMGIAETAPPAMADAAIQVLQRNRINASNIRFVVPHQAGAGIVRFTQIKLETVGITAEVVNGLTRDVGNVSSGSVPFALKQYWSKLHGNILCPVAAVGSPGKPEVSEGCILLRGPTRSKAQAA
jgi:3-oxoacyl-[acyl-carrier-protein] synthase III